MALGGLCDLAFSVSPILFSLTLLFVCIEHYSVLHFHNLERAMPSPTLRTLHMLLSVCNVLAVTPVLEIPAEMSCRCCSTLRPLQAEGCFLFYDIKTLTHILMCVECIL